MKGTPLELLRDDDGSVVLGWVGNGVLYARFEGSLSAAVGAAFAARLEAHAADVPAFEYFSDGSALASFDLRARSAFFRVVLTHRPKFMAIVMLTWAGGISSTARAFAEAVGDHVDILTGAPEFHVRLRAAAPHALRSLDPSTWTRVAPLQLLRP
jgi:hypothetical protein